MKKYTVRICIRVTPSEREYLEKCAAETEGIRSKNGIPILSEYLRALIFSRSGLRDEETMRQLRGIRYELRKIGVNVNQIARKINSGFGDHRDVRELKEYLKRIEKAFEGLEEEAQKPWRSQD